MADITLLPESDSVKVDELHITEDGHLKMVKANTSMVSMNHFKDSTPVTLADIPHRYGQQRANAGIEGETAVNELFINAGVPKENILKSHLFRTINGEEELWDGVVLFPKLAIVLQVKTRLTEFETVERSRSWVRQSSRAINRQVHKTMLDWQNCVPWYETFKTHNGTERVLPYNSVPCMYLGVLAVNDLFRAEPAKYFTKRNDFKLNIPGLIITLKELKTVFELLSLEEGIKYLTYRSTFPEWHLGFETIHLYSYLLENKLNKESNIIIS